MPTYDYTCQSCGQTLEVFQSMKDAHIIECPTCHKNTFKRMIGLGGGILFKGSGFYETDYKRQPKPESSQSNTLGEKKANIKAKVEHSANKNQSKDAK